MLLVTRPMMFVAAVKCALSLWYVAFHISFNLDLAIDTLNGLIHASKMYGISGQMDQMKILII